MFQEVIQKLHTSIPPDEPKEEILTKGIEIFDKVLKSQNLTTGDEAVQIAVKEFSSAFNGNPEATTLFKLKLQKELSGLEGVRILKSKIKILRKSWEIESRAILQTPKRKRIVTLRLTEEEYNYLVTKAQEEGITLSEYIRHKLGLVNPQKKPKTQKRQER